MRYGPIVVGFVAAATLMAGAVFGEEKKMDVKDFPAPVKAAVEAAAKDGKVVEAEVDKEDGKEIFSVEVEKDGKKTEFEFAADGKMIKSEEVNEEKEGKEGKDEEEEGDETVVELSKAPEAIQAALKKVGAEITTLTMEEEDDVKLYEAEFMKGGLPQSLKLTEAGVVIEEESGVDKASLPAAVVKAIEKMHAGATIEKAEQVKQSFFEIAIVKGDKKHEVKINAAGQKLEGEKEKSGKDKDDDEKEEKGEKKGEKEDKD
jgi:uncharacterized membrane protein YkoI